jgi:hypothetical protein
LKNEQRNENVCPVKRKKNATTTNMGKNYFLIFIFLGVLMFLLAIVFLVDTGGSGNNRENVSQDKNAKKIERKPYKIRSKILRQEKIEQVQNYELFEKGSVTVFPKKFNTNESVLFREAVEDISLLKIESFIENKKIYPYNNVTSHIEGVTKNGFEIKYSFQSYPALLLPGKKHLFDFKNKQKTVTTIGYDSRIVAFYVENNSVYCEIEGEVPKTVLRLSESSVDELFIIDDFNLLVCQNKFTFSHFLFKNEKWEKYDQFVLSLSNTRVLKTAKNVLVFGSRQDNLYLFDVEKRVETKLVDGVVDYNVCRCEPEGYRLFYVDKNKVCRVLGFIDFKEKFENFVPVSISVNQESQIMIFGFSGNEILCFFVSKDGSITKTIVNTLNDQKNTVFSTILHKNLMMVIVKNGHTISRCIPIENSSKWFSEDLNCKFDVETFSVSANNDVVSIHMFDDEIKCEKMVLPTASVDINWIVSKKTIEK